MKKLTDAEIQELLEENLTEQGIKMRSSHDKDVEAYLLLFEELRTEPAVNLPPDFAAAISRQINLKKARVADLKLYLSVAVVFITGLAAAYLSIAALNYGYASQIVDILFKYKWLLLFTLFFLLNIQFLDENFIKKYRASF